MQKLCDEDTVAPISDPPQPLNALVLNSAEREVLLGEHADAIESAGWTVVNGVAPLSGVIAWESEPRRGSYYAAGPRAEYVDIWRQAGGYELRFITNEDIRRTVLEWIRKTVTLQPRETPERAIVRLGGIQQLSAELGLPWFDEGLFQTECMTLELVVRDVIRKESRAILERMQGGYAGSLEPTIILHAVSEIALQATVKKFQTEGWRVTLESSSTRGAAKKITRTWRMIRAN